MFQQPKMSFKKGGFESDNDEDENVGHLGYNMNPDNVIELRVRARSNPNFCISQLDDADDIQLNRQLSGQDILNEIRRRSSRHLTPNLIPAPTLVEDPALEISITIADELTDEIFQMFNGATFLWLRYDPNYSVWSKYTDDWYVKKVNQIFDKATKIYK